jgi:hypothetical protein
MGAIEGAAAPRMAGARTASSTARAATVLLMLVLALHVPAILSPAVDNRDMSASFSERPRDRRGNLQHARESGGVSSAQF